jgi:hypothetical protein
VQIDGIDLIGMGAREIAEAAALRHAQRPHAER